MLGKPEKKCGIKASDTREITFDRCQGAEGEHARRIQDGFRMAVSILNSGRIGVSFQAIGIAQAALEEAIKYSKERKQFDQPIANFQAIQFKLADMATRIDAGRLLAYRAAQLKDQGSRVHREASMAKLFCSQMANYVCNEAVQIHGGYGYIKEYAVERYFRDARVTELYEGTSEAQRMVISTRLAEGLSRAGKETSRNIARRSGRSALEKIEPPAATLDREQRFLDEHMKPLTEMGLLSMPDPGSSTAADRSTRSAIRSRSKKPRASAARPASRWRRTTRSAPFRFYKFGTEEQRKKYLPRAAKGELIAFGLVRAGCRLRCRRDPHDGRCEGADHWMMNGSKCWITSATKAFATIATARTSDDPEDKEITCFILEKAWKGYAVGKKENKLGLRGSDTAFLHFDDLKVPVENQLGESRRRGSSRC